MSETIPEAKNSQKKNERKNIFRINLKSGTGSKVCNTDVLKIIRI
jgi:hypothetical protein